MFSVLTGKGSLIIIKNNNSGIKTFDEAMKDFVGTFCIYLIS